MKNIKIGVVGPCASGKTTLIVQLKNHGLDAQHIAQEHSYVADMWRRLTNPDILIYLDVSYPLTIKRRNLNWTWDEYSEQVYRLRHARQHANFYLDTDDLTPGEVFFQVFNFLASVSKDNI